MKENDMLLPKGRTCRSCTHIPHCKQLFGCKPDNIECDWSPCRYVEYHGPETPTPSKVTDKPTAPVGLIEWLQSEIDQAKLGGALLSEKGEFGVKFMEKVKRESISRSPTTPVPSKSESGLREAIKEYLNNDCPPIAWYSLDEKEREYFKGVECVQRILARILESNPSIPTPPEEIEPLCVNCVHNDCPIGRFKGKATKCDSYLPDKGAEK